MIAELGHYALVLALFIAIVQSVAPMVGAQRNDQAWMATAGPTAIAQFLCVATAFAALTYSYVVSDFSVTNVFQNSHTDKPMMYKISGVWANHEGSMVLWVLILALYGMAVALFGKNLPPALRARTLGIQALITVGFLLFILLTSNPFIRILDQVPLNGQGLNPLLQDPGLAFHPPMLYLGYVGFSIAFSFAVAALIEGRVDAAWARWVRPWTLAAWIFLTLGIGLGSWWAYYELGWGGWWYWDPVENASFMPWLAGTALLHSAIVVEKRDTLKNWTILLAIIAFGLSLLGTFLVRSGILTSVHSFASDPTRGVFVLGLLVVAVGGSLTLYAIRAPSLKSGGLFAPISREGGLVLNNLLLTVGTATVLLGTLYPLIADAFNLGKVSVGPPFYNATFVPLMIPLILAMAVGPLMSWKRADLRGVLSRMKAALAASLFALALTLFMAGVETEDILAGFGIGLGVWLGMGALIDVAERVKLFKASGAETLRRARNLPRAAYGQAIAHFGMAVFVAGAAGISFWQLELVQTQKPGESVMMAGYEFRFDGAERTQGPNYMSDTGHFTILKDGVEVAKADPEKRMYTAPPRPTSEAAIRTNYINDLYVVIGDPVGTDGAYVTRLYYKPMAPILWYGFILMGLGGLVSLSDRRHRVGAPAKRKVKAPSAASPQPAE